MTDTEILALLRTIATRHEENVNDDEGDKYLSDPNLFSEVMCDILLSGDVAKAKRDGWIA